MIRKVLRVTSAYYSYLVYKRCPGISENVWILCMLAFKTADYPDKCRSYFEGVYIPKVEGDFSPSTGRPISLGNVQGKVYMAILAKRLSEIHKYSKTSMLILLFRKGELRRSRVVLGILEPCGR